VEAGCLPGAAGSGKGAGREGRPGRGSLRPKLSPSLLPVLGSEGILGRGSKTVSAAMLGQDSAKWWHYLTSIQILGTFLSLSMALENAESVVFPTWCLVILEELVVDVIFVCSSPAFPPASEGA